MPINTAGHEIPPSTKERSMVESYLHAPDTRYEQLTIHNDRLGEPMDTTCVAALIVPAHNEAKNIEAFLAAIQRQKFSPESGLSPTCVEVIIVVNNSTDNTAQIAKEYLAAHPSKIKIRVISEEFDEDEKGVGAARRLGADLAIFRAAERGDEDTDEFYLLGLDADNPRVPEDHLETYIKTFRETGREVLAGRVRINPADIPEGAKVKEIAELVFSYFDFRRVTPDIPSETSGANHGVSRRVYVKVGGYPRTKTGEDTYIGREAERQGYELGYVKSPVDINLRRFNQDPLAYIVGQAWEPKRFVAQNEKIRQSPDEFSDISPSSVRTVLTSMVDMLAFQRAERDQIDPVVAVREERDAFCKFAKEKLNPDDLPSNELFCVDQKHHAVLERNKLTDQAHSELLKTDLAKLHGIIAGSEYFLTGHTAAWLENLSERLPLVLNLAIADQEWDDFNERMEHEGYVLFQVDGWSNQTFCRRVQPIEAQELIGEKDLVYVPANSYGIPIWNRTELPMVTVSVFTKTPEGIRFTNKGPDELNTLGYNITEIQNDGQEFFVADELLLLEILSIDPEGGEAFLSAYNKATSDLKEQFINWLASKIRITTRLLTDILVQIKESSQEKQPQAVGQLLNDLVGEPRTENEQERLRGLQEMVLDLLKVDVEEMSAKIRAFVVDSLVPVQIKSEISLYDLVAGE